MGSPEAGEQATVEIKVRQGGPYKVTGAVRLVDHEGREIPFDDERPIVLCRCGRSATKPFCDQTHRSVEVDA